MTTAPAPRLDRMPSPTRLAATDEACISILYIEDNPANVEVISRLVQGLPNARIQSVVSGRAGIELANRDDPDVILLDLDLPDLHGSEVLHHLKSEAATAQIPVVILSADATPGASRRLLACGALAYLTKPIDLVELIDLLDAASSLRRDLAQTLPDVTPA